MMAMRFRSPNLPSKWMASSAQCPHHLGLVIQSALHGLQHFFMLPTPGHGSLRHEQHMRGRITDAKPESATTA
jgi:hypothetical protein